ncbi:CAP domain-containing protein [Rhizobiaceae bacterium n13]|uniref:CAP domain-containing protein n=1 Tax=Ferirhizobium litorale TaxID=2927786 RepID=A0AAE3QJH6_9HYPH|nr:CAP domain-containing protein [Fererhizobium litorale]MDI7864930.1 CAP domain-containing protein [Fererhizobium litorale]MDI7925050.1 CAP domain-containing protein [Fererhizobium litorale]
MPKHNANEQYLLELINAERAKAGAQPLAFDNDLSEAAQGHSKWMLAADVFSHTGSGGSSATQRMKDAGYLLQGSWATGENIAWATTRAPAGYQDEVKLLHTNLMNSSGHRANLLNPNFREVGLGVEVGDYKGRSSAFVTENFAKTGSDTFLTGVAFDDRDGDRFYDPGEGLGSIAVTAKNSAGQVFKTTTSAAGGYDLVLKPGTYTVTFSGADIAKSTKTVTIGTKNVKVDLVDPTMTSGTLSATAATDVPAPDAAPVQAPVASDASDGSANPTSNAWLAKFFKQSGTLSASDGDGAPVAGNGDHPAFAPGGDELHFRPSAAAHGNADEISDLFDEMAEMFGHLDAVASRVTGPSFDFQAPAEVADASHDALARIVAQMRADAGSLHADLLI